MRNSDEKKGIFLSKRKCSMKKNELFGLSMGVGDCPFC